MQVGEFTSIVGLIKRTQTLFGVIFTVSGVICAFRRRALLEVGFWSPEALTDDVDVTLRIQLADWRAVYEPRALCWILMPETFKGLWRQRLRWSAGGTATVLSSFGTLISRGRWAMFVIWLTDAIVGGFRVNGFWTLVGATVVVWAVGAAADHWLFPRKRGLKRVVAASSRFGRV